MGPSEFTKMFTIIRCKFFKGLINIELIQSFNIQFIWFYEILSENLNCMSKARMRIISNLTEHRADELSFQLRDSCQFFQGVIYFLLMFTDRLKVYLSNNCVSKLSNQLNWYSFIKKSWNSLHPYDGKIKIL